MCGLLGAIGAGWSQYAIRALTLANMERGTDSLGFFDSSGKMTKTACSPDEALAKPNISEWLDKSERSSWFVAGHTRQATRGKVNRQNSHPFRYGKIVGSHNGMVDAPNGYVVDSQYLFDTLNKAGGDYNAAWGKISGYWGIAWFDGNAFYLQVHNGSLAVGLAEDGCYYYSSTKAHLAACIGANAPIQILTEGQTLRFTFKDGNVILKEDVKFVSVAPEYWARKYGCSNARGYSKYGTYYEDDYTTDSTTTAVQPRDYDSEWRSSWEEYINQSEHSRID